MGLIKEKLKLKRLVSFIIGLDKQNKSYVCEWKNRINSASLKELKQIEVSLVLRANILLKIKKGRVLASNFYNLEYSKEIEQDPFFELGR